MSNFFSVCIEGTKGAGKSSTIEQLNHELTKRGIDVEVCAPFAEADAFARAQGFDGAVLMIQASKADNRREIEFLTETIEQAGRDARAKAEHTGRPTLLIYDRGWLTAMPHLFNGKWFQEDREHPEDIHRIFGELLRQSSATIFLHASLEVTKRRRPNLDAISGLETEEKLRSEIDGRVAFAERFREKIVLSFDTGQTPQNEVVSKIAAYVADHLAIPAALPKKFVALYPGSYNLPTLAHRDIGMATLGLTKPDAVWYLVSPQNPHKSTEGMASFEDRLAMAKLNVEDEPRLVVTDIEKRISERTGSTRTADTLRELIRLYPETHFAFVMGADNFAKLDTWYNYPYLIANASFIIFPRKGHTEAAFASKAAKDLPELSRIDLRTQNGWNFVREYPEGDLSATQQRKAIKQGAPLDPRRVHPKVAAYVKLHKPGF